MDVAKNTPPRAARRRWDAPTVARMKAGDAENGSLFGGEAVVLLS